MIRFVIRFDFDQKIENARNPVNTRALKKSDSKKELGFF